MKKHLTSFLLVSALLLTMAGCSASRLEYEMDAAEVRMEQRLDAAEAAVENAVRNVTAPAPAAVPEAAATTETAITREEAEKIALDYVGLTLEQVRNLRSGFEVDDGVAQYDVEFLADDWEYEFEIGAKDGTILSFDKDHRYD